jgi:putative ABC transport system ATP-binding protein
MPNLLIEATDVVKVLGSGAGQVQALKGVTMSLTGGELALLMGPSGSGKTTLLSVLGCLLSPTRGTVRVHGVSTQRLTAEELAKVRREHIGFIFQSYHLFPTLSARDNVQLALDVRGDHAGATTRADEALAAVGLAHKVTALPRELSGGEQQRVAIARAIVGKPSVILADEPTGALDSENGQAIMTVLAQFAKNPSHAVLVVTHDPRILSFADRIMHIEDGRIVREEHLEVSARQKQQQRDDKLLVHAD